MAFPAGTEAPSGSGEDTITSMLSQDLSGGGNGVAEHVAEDPSVADVDIATEEQPVEPQEPAETEPTDTGADDATDEEGAADDETGDEEFDPQGLETDFAESAYQKAAAHWAKRGVQLDPNDVGQRAMLKDWMERGQKIAELSKTAEAAEETEEKPAETPATPAKTPQEQFQDRWNQVKEYAKSSVVPEVATAFGQKFVDALWPGKNVKMTPEQSRGLAEAFTEFGSLLILDAIPGILSQAPNAVQSAYPMLNRVHSMAEREAVVEDLLAANGADGHPAYPGIDKMLESGTIKRILDGPELKTAVFDKDPYKNLLARTKIAYKMARGIRPDPKTLEKAVQRGAAVATARARNVAAGRLSPGSPSGRSTTNATGSKFMDSLLSNSGSKFSRLLKEQGR